MHLYLPIAELSANAFQLIALGGIAGLLAGLFGIGGGFILTPMLMFMGISPAVAVATSTNMIVASSFSGFLTHMKHKRVDLRLGAFLIAGGLLGVALGVWLFAGLQRAGQIDLMIQLLYISLMLGIGIMMLRESWQQRRASRQAKPATQEAAAPIGWLKRLPWQVHFARSEQTHSALLPLAIGVVSGLLVGLLGIGGGFIMLPLMLYVLRMPVPLTVGTSLFQIIFITSAATILHALTTHAVDVVLAALLLMGSVVGAQYGARWHQRLPGHWLKLLLAMLLMAVAARLAYGLFITPASIFTLTMGEG
jgi:uncharacterized membrane protein YfcA